MLNQMCHEVLSNADITAIRKTRGFKSTETESRSQFESFFLSSIGLETAMLRLTPKEVAALHLLHRKVEDVDLTFFERLYGSDRREERYYYGTFTQQYKDTFKDVKQNLLRCGLLVMAELRTRSDNTKMERWRFRFPPEFAAYLPPLVSETRIFDTPGDDRSNQVQREKVLEVLGIPTRKPFFHKEFKSELARGYFNLGKETFSVKRLSEWQQSEWVNSLKITMPNDGDQSISPVEAVKTILESLAPGEWVTLDQLAIAYDIFCFGVKAPPLQVVCETGWLLGGLVRHIEDNNTCYRLPVAPRSEAENIALDAYLTPMLDGDALEVDLQTIPFDALETLNILAHLKVEQNQLVASPSQIKLGRAAPEIRESPLGNWLSTQFPAFGRLFDVTEKSWGKTILHSNLLVARIKDLSLRVQLERQLGYDLALLSEEFVAFPVGARREVEKIVQKGGFVVKTVRA